MLVLRTSLTWTSVIQFAMFRPFMLIGKQFIMANEQIEAVGMNQYKPNVLCSKKGLTLTITDEF